MSQESHSSIPDPEAMYTAWSLVLKAQGKLEASVTRQRCKEYLAARFWTPVFILIRKNGHSEEEAKDLTQSYFTTFLEKNFLDQVSPARGRMRNFIHSSVKNFLANWHDYHKAAKRHPKGKLVSFDVSDSSNGSTVLPVPSDQETPDEAYMREWARSVMIHAIDEMAKTCEVEGLGDCWEVFRRHVSEASQFGDPSYEQTATSLQWDVEKVRRELFRARRRFSEVVREVLRGSLENEADIEGELNDLRRYFAAQRT